MIQKIKGTMDLLPNETPLWRHIEGIMREEAEKYGFGEIRTPTFENTELFVRGVGDTTDVVQKEMYTFADREENTTWGRVPLRGGVTWASRSPYSVRSISRVGRTASTWSSSR